MRGPPCCWAVGSCCVQPTLDVASWCSVFPKPSSTAHTCPLPTFPAATGSATHFYYWACNQPVPDLSLGSDHSAHEWTGTGVFCGTSGALNSLLVSTVLTLLPASACIAVSGEQEFYSE